MPTSRKAIASSMPASVSPCCFDTRMASAEDGKTGEGEWQGAQHGRRSVRHAQAELTHPHIH
jgi:hypothetical protein